MFWGFLGRDVSPVSDQPQAPLAERLGDVAKMWPRLAKSGFYLFLTCFWPFSGKRTEGKTRRLIKQSKSCLQLQLCLDRL